MKKFTLKNLIIPIVSVMIMLISFLCVSSYIKLVSDNLSKADTAINNSFDIYQNYSQENFSENFDKALATLRYINVTYNKLLAEGNSPKSISLKDILSSDQPSIIPPDYINFLDSKSLDELVNQKTSNKDAVTALNILQKKDNSLPIMYYDCSDSESGFYIVFPASDDSKDTYEYILAFYNAKSFVNTFLCSDIITNGEYSIYTLNNASVLTYDATKKTCEIINKNEFLSNHDILSDNKSRESVFKELTTVKTSEFDVIANDTNQKKHVFYTPLVHDNCHIEGLYTFTTIPDTSGLTDDIVSLAKSRGTNIIIILFIIFIIISLALLIIQNYYDKKSEQSTQKLHIESNRYQAIAENSNWIIYEYDHKTSLLSIVNDKDFEPTIIQQYRYTLIRENLIHPDDIDILDEMLENVSSGYTNFKCELRFYEDKSYVWYEVCGNTMFDTEDSPVLTMIIYRDINAQKKEMEAIKNTSEHDSLTKVYNLSGIKNAISPIINDSNSSFMHAFLLVDIDNFLAITDKYGQTFADAILLDFSSMLSNIIGKNDLIGRVGGDKFIVFLYNMPTTLYAEEMANIILNIFNDTYAKNEIIKNMTVSIGISLFPNHGDTFEELIRTVDIALYHSKTNGKNRFTVYDDSFATTNTGHNFINLLLNNEITTNNASIDNDILYNVIELLFESRELSASIPMAFSLIGNYYNLDQLGMIDYSEDEALAIRKYSWNSPAFDRFANNLTSLDIKSDSTFTFFKESPNGIFYTNELSNMNIEESAISDIVKCAGIQSIFQSSVTDNGILNGYLFAHSLNVVEWQGHIADTLTLLAKIVSSYLIKQNAQENINKLTKTDMLTGSDNLFTYITKCTELSATYPEQQFATIYVDINKFKLINDKFGYSVGDKVLIDFAEIITKNISIEERFCRADADKFVLFLKFNGMSDLDSRIMSVFKQFSNHLKSTIGYRANLVAGVYLSKNEIDISAAVDKANIARKSIKNRHHSTYEMFNESMKSSLIIKNDIENAMEMAITREEFKIFYQPKFDIFTNKICGSEALVRWERPDSGLYSPNTFIPIFEDNGFITEVDFYVFDKVCALLRKLMDEGVTVYPVSVNFSRLHLKNKKIISKLSSTIAKYNIDPSLIEVEITESALEAGDDLTPTLLTSIKNLGFKLSMDDFGSGLSSLNSLRKFPFDILKLDKDFFHSNEISEKEKIVIGNVVNLAKQLNMSIISEGIEYEEQAQFLRDLNCPVVQGFLYSPPIPEEKFVSEYIRK